MTKKANTSKVNTISNNTINTVSDNAISSNARFAPVRNCSVFSINPELQGDCMFYDLVINANTVLMANIARISMDCRNALDNALAMEKAQMNKLHENKLHEVNMKAAQIIKTMESIGVFITMSQAMEQAKIALNYVEKPIVNAPIKRAGLHIRSNDNAGQTDNELIARILTAYNGRTFKELPLEVQGQFNTTTRAKYPSVCGYYRQILNGTGTGAIADLLNQKPVDEITPDDIKALNLDPSTKGRFRQALDIYKATI